MGEGVDKISQQTPTNPQTNSIVTINSNIRWIIMSLLARNIPFEDPACMDRTFIEY